MKGRIHALQGGNYAVATATGPLACRARGLFRSQGRTPLVGDEVVCAPTGPGEGYILELLPRKNALARPPVANVDQLFLLCATTQPRPNLRLLDTLLAVTELSGIAPVVVFTKCDLAPGGDFAAAYRAFDCLCVGKEDEAAVEELHGMLKDKTSVFCGNTGVGKSTLLNKIAPGLALPTGEISEKLGRGRHTTRHVALYPAGGGWVADTPGFGTLEPLEQSRLTKDALAEGFREFAPHAGACRFADCAHMKDKGCAVIAAVEHGKIPSSRWESYCALYKIVKQKNDWEV
ncbi:MAG: ribosome small subunit-dependent GTPase A [Oscillospiraceae bacterium]|nr:ribosome small subunit-dependent GTPase A [Oscillospiraceae bacterium]